MRIEICQCISYHFSCKWAYWQGIDKVIAGWDSVTAFPGSIFHEKLMLSNGIKVQCLGDAVLCNPGETQCAFDYHRMRSSALKTCLTLSQCFWNSHDCRSWVSNKVYASVCLGYCKEWPWPGWLKQQIFVLFRSSGGWEAPNLGANRLSVCWGPTSWSSSDGRKRDNFLGVSFSIFIFLN